MDDKSIDIGSLTANLKPSIVTPYLSQLTGMTSEQKLRKISTVIVQQMIDTFNSSKNAKVPRVVMHEGEAIEVRYLDISNLLIGVWPAVSLMLLQLSIGEQLILIDSLYPKSIQLSAKKFAVTFTNPKQSGSNLTLKTDPLIVDKLDSVLSGVAMLLAEMSENGIPKPHPDKMEAQMKLIEEIMKEKRLAFKKKQASERAYEANRHKDKQR